MFLAHHFLKYFNQLYTKDVWGITDAVEQIFLKHNRPGNIRELKNCMERAIIFYLFQIQGDRIFYRLLNHSI